MAQTYTCRFCFEESDNVNDFIVPCLCTGSSKYIHRQCLDRWRSEDPDGINFHRCGTCHFEYEIINQEDDPELEKKRQIEYKKAIALDVTSLIFNVVIAIVCVGFILYLLDSCGFHFIRSYIWKHFHLTNTILVFSLASIGILLILLAIGSCIFFLRDIRLLFNTHHFISGMSNILVIGFAILIGLIVAIPKIFYFIDSSRRKHRQRIWLQHEAQIKVVRDFSPNGPPRPN